MDTSPHHHSLALAIICIWHGSILTRVYVHMLEEGVLLSLFSGFHLFNVLSTMAIAMANHDQTSRSQVKRVEHTDSQDRFWNQTTWPLKSNLG
jgi:hypothetical protein